MTQGLGDVALAPCQWLQYADQKMDPIRRSQNGSITPVTDWILYGDHGMEPICRSVTMSGAAFLRIKKLKGGGIITVAARHNRRVIQAEIGASGSIDPTRSGLNETLQGPSTAADVGQLAKDLMAAAGVVKLRKDAVMALEIVFSLPPGHQLDDKAYFTDCAAWAGAYFGCVNLSVDIHRDEAAPHCHALLLPLIDGRMIGNKIAGGKQKIAAMHKDFFDQVAARHGLSKAPARLTGAAKQAAVKAVLQKMRETGDSALQSAAWATIRDGIENDPGPFLLALGIVLSAPKKKLKTTAAIFTSKGKGKVNETNAIAFAPKEKDRRLCSVAFPPKPPPTVPAPALPDGEIKAAVGEVKEAPFVETTTRVHDSDLDPARFHDGDYCAPSPPAPRRHKQAVDAALMALNDRQVKQGFSFSVRANL